MNILVKLFSIWTCRDFTTLGKKSPKCQKSCWFFLSKISVCQKSVFCCLFNTDIFSMIILIFDIKNINFENQILVIFDPNYLSHYKSKQKTIWTTYSFWKILYSVGCATLCFKSEVMIILQKHTIVQCTHSRI